LLEWSKLLFWAAVALTGYGVLILLAHQSLYSPMRYPQGEWGFQGKLGAQDVWLTTGDGVKLHGWWIPGDDPRVVTLHLHGNGGNITHRAYHAERIVDAGSALLLLDYRGYGRSSGSAREAGLYRDAEAAYDHLIAKGWRPEQIVVHGESLGSAVAVDLASRRKTGGVILEAPFTSAKAVAGRVLPFVGSWLIWGFDPKSKIERINAPLLIIHGDRDEVIDYKFGRELFEAAREPKEFWTIQGAGHNDIPFIAGGRYREKLAAFYRNVPK
jgi:fermentation-respiration switch protein FrsA (DUF1100 family)